MDNNFNLYLTDYTLGNLWAVPWTGAGYGTGLIVQVGLSLPTAVSVDASGNVYIADSSHNWIWKDTPSGTAYTGSVFLRGLNNPLGVAVDGNGNVSIADSEGQVAKWTWLIRRRCLFRSLPGSVRSIAAMAR